MGHITDRCRSWGGRFDHQNLSCDQASSSAGQLQGKPIGAANRAQRRPTRRLGLDGGQDPDVGGRRWPDRERRRWRRSLRDPARAQGEEVDRARSCSRTGGSTRDPADELPQLPGRPAPVVDHVELRSDESSAAVVRMGGDQFRLADLHRHARVGPHLRDQEERRDDAARGGVLDHRHVAVRAERRVWRFEQITRPLGEQRCRQTVVGMHGSVEIDQLGTVVQPSGTQDEALPELTWQQRSSFATAVAPDDEMPGCSLVG